MKANDRGTEDGWMDVWKKVFNSTNTIKSVNK